MSQNHKVEFNGKLYKARKFVGKFKGVSKILYNGETLYNILFENYRTITINNLVCETLQPSNEFAVMFSKICNPLPEMICA